MADRGDTHYHVPNLNKWFAVASVALLITTVWMVIDDWNAPWKRYQREFRRMEVERTEAALAEPAYQEAASAEEALRQDLQEALLAQDRRKADIEKLEEELIQAKGEQCIRTESAKKKKQELNFLVFQVEEHRMHAGDPTYEAERLTAAQQDLVDAEGLQEAADLRVTQIERQLAELRDDV